MRIGIAVELVSCYCFFTFPHSLSDFIQVWMFRVLNSTQWPGRHGPATDHCGEYVLAEAGKLSFPWNSWEENKNLYGEISREERWRSLVLYRITTLSRKTHQCNKASTKKSDVTYSMTSLPRDKYAHLFWELM